LRLGILRFEEGARVLGQPSFFVQLTSGVLYGYRGAFANKVPFNHNGYAPAVVGAFGWHLDRHGEVTIDVLGAAAVMFQYAYNLR
jgi:hypothetical protein